MKNLTYKSVFKYVFTFFAFVMLNNALNEVPLCISLFVAFLNSGFLIIPLFLSFFISLLLNYKIGQIVAISVSALFICLIFYAYQKQKANLGFLIYLLTAISLLTFFLPIFSGDFVTKLILSFIIIILTMLFCTATNLLFLKKFSRKFYASELCSISFLIVFLSYGLIKITNQEVWQSICLLCILVLCYFYKSPKAFIPALIMPISLAIYNYDISILAIFQIYCGVCLLFISSSKLLSAFAVIVTQCLYLYVAKKLNDMSYLDYAYTFFPTVIFLFLPNKIIEFIKQNLQKFGNNDLSREIINNERAVLSSKLFSLSDIFCQIENSLISMGNLSPEKDDIVEKITDELYLNVCNQCKIRQACIEKNKPDRYDITKLVNLGIAKGKVTLLDISKDFSSYCYNTNSMLYEINKMINIYADYIEKNNLKKKAQELVVLQAGAFSNVLKNFAYNLSSKVAFKRKQENFLFDKLCYEGFIPIQIACLDDNEEFHVVFENENTDITKAGKIIGGLLNQKICLKKQINLGNNLILAVYINAPIYDACFGISQMTKEGSISSGDTHSLIKINCGTFMVTLCDGMGSGEKAKHNSQITISLIENMYKALVPYQTVLDLSNKIISLCGDDSFTAIDIASIDLYNATCDTIKVGATFGFILSENNINIIENSSLPLGILEQLNPSCSHYQLNDGDTLLLMSDGITDAFFSSTDMIDYLSMQNATNPQTLADNVLQKALDLNEGIAKDDMTVIAIKIFKK